MQIVLNRPYAINELGRHENQEDSVFPEVGAATPETSFFLVCDGVGGHSKGEVASRAVCDAFASAIQNTGLPYFGKPCFEEALKRAYARLDAEHSHGDLPKMGTTLTFACFHRGGAFVAHIGDSRIYQFRRRGGRVDVLYKSGDHSQVSELVRAGAITQEEAASHPRRNVLTRVMQPQEESPASADVFEITDMAAGDYFFLCTDGVLESLGDGQLCEILGREVGDGQKMAAILAACKQGSRDNFSAYLIPVAHVTSGMGEKLINMLRRSGHPCPSKPRPGNPMFARRAARAWKRFRRSKAFFPIVAAVIGLVVTTLAWAIMKNSG